MPVVRLLHLAAYRVVNNPLGQFVIDADGRHHRAAGPPEIVVCPIFGTTQPLDPLPRFLQAGRVARRFRATGHIVLARKNPFRYLLPRLQYLYGLSG